ncbi:MAG: universal stress protein [Myxococcota bacterium]
MSLYKNILHSIDFSQENQATIQDSLLLAKASGAKVTYFHVLDELVLNHPDKLSFTPASLQAELSKRVEECIRTHLGEGEKVDYAIEIPVGKPMEMILKRASAGDVDVLLMGQQHAPFLERVLLGSVAEKVLREVDVPVMLLHSEKRLEPLDKILVPVDFSEASGLALRQAYNLAHAHQAELYVLNIVEFQTLLLPNGFETFEVAVDLPQALKDKEEVCMKEFLDNSGLDFSKIPTLHSNVGIGSVYREILAYAEEKATDLTVMGSVGRSGLRGLVIGNQAERVARACARPLLVVKPMKLL